MQSHPVDIRRHLLGYIVVGGSRGRDGVPVRPKDESVDFSSLDFRVCSGVKHQIDNQWLIEDNVGVLIRSV